MIGLWAIEPIDARNGERWCYLTRLDIAGAALPDGRFGGPARVESHDDASLFARSAACWAGAEWWKVIGAMARAFETGRTVRFAVCPSKDMPPRFHGHGKGEGR